MRPKQGTETGSHSEEWVLSSDASEKVRVNDTQCDGRLIPRRHESIPPVVKTSSSTIEAGSGTAAFAEPLPEPNWVCQVRTSMQLQSPTKLAERIATKCANHNDHDGDHSTGSMLHFLLIPTA